MLGIDGVDCCPPEEKCVHRHGIYGEERTGDEIATQHDAYDWGVGEVEGW